MNFDEKTYENLLQEKLDMVDNKYDKRESSLIYNALAPNSMETRSMYIFIQWVLDNVFGDTAEREYLKRIALFTKGLIPAKATRAVYRLETNVQVEIGSKFTSDVMTFEVAEEMESSGGYYNYKAQCSEYGIAGNGYAGTAIPVEYIQGLEHCELAELLVPGEDEEDTEVFRKRWKNSFNNIAFGGNKADYKAKVNSIDGVGDCKVYRAENAEGEESGGNVRIVIIDSAYAVPSAALVEKVQKEIDPTKDGEGVGIAPIAHIVNIEAVKGLKIYVTAKVVCDTGYGFEDVKNIIETKIKEYLLSLSRTWADAENIVVRRSQIESVILSVPYVLDVTDTMLNGAEENIILGKDSIPVLGGVENAA